MAFSAPTRSIPVEFEDNWKGVLDPQRRRTLQNRLNQRARRRRLKAARLDRAPGSLDESPTDKSPAGSTATERSDRQSTPGDHTSKYDSPPNNDIERLSKKSSPALRSPTATPTTTTTTTSPHQIPFIELDRFKILGPSSQNSLRAICKLEAFYRAEFAAGSLRTELLLGLTRLNFLRALHVNIDVLGYSAAEMHDDAFSPFGCAGAAKIAYNPVHRLPAPLRPTRIQLTVPHHPWLDLIPFPKLRDNLILMGDALDDTRLCHDMSGKAVSLVPKKRAGLAAGETGVIVWRDPWDPSGWEVTESFFRRWGWTLRECWDVFEVANRWRRVRGEPALFRYDLHDLKTAQDAEAQFNRTGATCAVFAAGSSLKPYAIDRDAAKVAIAAATSLPSVAKFLMISFSVLRRKPAPWWDSRDIADYTSEHEYLVAMANQRRARGAGGQHTYARAPPFQAISLRPTWLTTGRATGRVSIGEMKALGQVSIEDVAAVAVEILGREDVSRWFDLVAGEVEVQEAVESVVQGLGVITSFGQFKPGVCEDLCEIHLYAAERLSDVASDQVWNPLLILSCFFFAASSMLFGFDDKVISPVAAMDSFVEKFQGSDHSTGTLALSSGNQNLVFCLPLVGSIIGSPPLYLSEVVRARYRGMAVTSSNILNLIAGVIATVICNATYSIIGTASFGIPLGAQAMLPVLMIPITIMLPGSPLRLLTKGRTTQARANLRKLRAFEDALVDDELRLMQFAHDSDTAQRADVTFWDLFKRGNIERTLVAGSMYSFNQCSGIILSSTYATIFLTNLGIGNPFQLTIAASSCILAGTLIAPLIIDCLGRRPTAIIGMSILLAIDIAAGTLAFFTDKLNVPLQRPDGSIETDVAKKIELFRQAFFSLPPEVDLGGIREYQYPRSISLSHITQHKSGARDPAHAREESPRQGHNSKPPPSSTLASHHPIASPSLQRLSQAPILPTTPS
ncbi:hypothetical protein HK57_00431 [Aspergillus ustus]|uniref:NAD(P)-binding domain-containing protein n=1 Tax=Aspergillus ustus TaxID=40382 RepID=A0A0C1E2P3_ASPUT|nr:hypothetical protein HK57_00431 [Aspergillus ustus]